MNEAIKADLTRIRNRQLAKFLVHLENKQALTPYLEKDVKRMFRFVFEDLEDLFTRTNPMNELDKEKGNGKTRH